jgi:hypothetical protein
MHTAGPEQLYITPMFHGTTGGRLRCLFSPSYTLRLPNFKGNLQPYLHATLLCLLKCMPMWIVQTFRTINIAMHFS